MAGLGVGLGAFVNGIDRGMDMRDRIDASREKADNKAALDKINTDGKAEFNKELGNGTATPDQWDQFYQQHVIPLRKMELLKQGDIEGANAWQAWSDSEDARKGSKLFGSALLKAQTGDPGGALEEALKAGQLKGYIDHGYSFKSQDTIQDQNGNVIGYRLTLNDGKKDIQQDVSVADVPKLIATYLSPDAAFASQQAAAAAKAKSADELGTYEEKKRLDQKYSTKGGADDTKARGNAITELRKSWSDPKNPDVTFNDLPDEQREGLIQKEIDFQRGPGATAPTAAAPMQRKVIVDQNTGGTIGLGDSPAMPGPNQKVSRPGAPAAAAPAPLAPAPGSQDRLPANAPMSSADQVLSSGVSGPQAVQQATSMLQQGQDPQTISQMLLRAGVPQDQWPSALVMGQQQQPIGTGF